MKINFKTIFLILNIFIFFNYGHSWANDDYPMTKGEREMEEMDSFLGGNALIFTPGKIKNESTKASLSTNKNINKYLWQAALEVLSFTPIISVNKVEGIIITDWYSPKDKANYSFKINLLIKDNIINPEALEVKVFERILKKGNWIQTSSTSNLKNILENKILLRARELYLKSEIKD